MNKTLIIIKKEFLSLLFSPLFRIVLAGFSFLLPFWFFIISGFFINSLNDFGGLTQLISVFLSLLLPLFTAGLWNRERKLGSDILLASMPVKTESLVIGKFFAVFFIGLLFLIVSFPSLYFAVRGVNGEPGVLISRFLALILITGMIISFGFFISSFFRSLILSYILTVCGILALLFFGSSGKYDANFLISPLLPSVRLTSFNLGLLKISDCLYFVLLCFILLFSVKLKLDRNGRKSSFIFNFLPFLFSFFLFFGLALIPFSADLTSNRRHSITKISKEALKEISFPLSVTYYKSDDIDSVFVDDESIERLLKLWADCNRNIYLNIETINSVKDGPLLEKEGFFPQSFAVQGNGIENRGFIPVYSGIKINYKGLTEVIPFVDNTGQLELLLYSALEKLNGIERPKVAVYVADSKREAGPDYGVLAGGLSEFFDVTFLTPESPVSNSSDIILVMGQRDLSVDNVVDLEKFRLTGGNVVFFIGGVYLHPESSDNASPYDYAPLLDFLNQRFGVRVERKLLLQEGDNRIETERTDGHSYDSYPFWIDPAQVSDDFLGNRFSYFTFLWPSPFSVHSLPDYNYRSLATTSADSWTMERGFDIKPESVNIGEKANNRVKSDLAMEISDKQGGEGKLILISGELSGSRLMELTNGIENIQVIKSLCFYLADKENYIRLERTDQKKKTAEPVGIYTTLALSMILWPIIIIISGLIIGSFRKRGRR